MTHSPKNSLTIKVKFKQPARHYGHLPYYFLRVPNYLPALTIGTPLLPLRIIFWRLTGRIRMNFQASGLINVNIERWTIWISMQLYISQQFSNKWTKKIMLWNVSAISSLFYASCSFRHARRMNRCWFSIPIRAPTLSEETKRSSWLSTA